MAKLQTVFFGSGPVALQSLQLLTASFDLEAIVTKPSTESDMRRAFPGTPVFTASRRAELDALCLKQQFKSRFGIVIDFGVIIDQTAIDSFPLGIINSHFSLLPEWRGVDPITFAILSGQEQTGVSLMLIVRAWDEGPLLAQAPYTLAPDITTPRLTDDLIELSDALLKEVVPKYVDGQIEPAPQLQASLLQGGEPTYSRKLTKEDGLIDWHKPAAVIEREIRAFISWPHSYTALAGRDVIITEARVVDTTPGQPGTVHVDRKTLAIDCGQQALEILKLKPAGKPDMTAQAFLAGYGRLLA